MMHGIYAALAAVFSLLPGEAQFLAGSALENQGKYAEAAAAFQQAHTQDDALRPYAALRIADCQRHLGKRDDALKAYKTVEADYPPGAWTQIARYRQALLYRESKLTTEAAKLFVGVVDIKPLPWWLEKEQASAVETLLATDSARPLGYELLNDRATTMIYRDARLDAARKLLTSNDPQYTANAITVLLRSGEQAEATKALLQALPLMPQIPDKATIATEILKDPAALTEKLAPLLDKNWGELFYNFAIRHLGHSKKYDEAEVLALLMQVRFPDSTEADTTQWWLARYVSDKNEAARAQRIYHAVVDKSPASEYADDALFYIGYHAMTTGKKGDAEKVFVKLAAEYPDSTYRPRVMWYAAQFREEAKDKEGARAHLQTASDNMLGDFFAHRAYDELLSLEAQKPPNYQNLKIDGVNSFVQPYNDPAPLLPLSAELTKTPAAQRLRFFGAHGLAEGEWEAVYYCLAISKHADAAQHYRLLAEAGFAHTVWQFLGEAKWGESESGKSIERQRLDFPLAYWPQVTALAQKLGIDPYLILALMKQESTFRATVVSSAGATGVMQVMPSTAKWLDQVDDNITKDHLANLKSPENSMQLGINYLERMIDRSNGNLVYALASYNAGPGNCDKWRKQFPGASMDTFVENMPFSETKNYVKRVLGNYAAYRSLYPAVQ